MHTIFWLESQKEKGQLGSPRNRREIILTLILERHDGIVWTAFIWL
jgi:hypothetical protein